VQPPPPSASAHRAPLPADAPEVLARFHAELDSTIKLERSGKRDLALNIVKTARGDSVIVEERMQATLPGGKPYENDYCFVFVLSADRIKLVREYMDTRKGWQMIFEPL